ncbi:Maf family nucleotide pyrophosphatase [Dokdonella sp.]|uniref:Maf family protein n=1 Tax=Dokdonella sp. TaxID=2291710 RepID=UPI001B26ACE1|nr:Maf family nucleotide pyrophosphatase [Dokdonella sp.]MBO9662705.1 septum formation inhibitor Maf [Dokdonella sp.]
MNAPVDLVLASTSRYRRELLSRLGLPFRAVAPEVDEASHPGETPRALACRLAQAKAEAVAARCPGALVIGSDQVAELDGRALGKPGSVAAAEAQLTASAGRSVLFHTALCLVDTRTAAAVPALACDLTRVVFRPLAHAEIARYVAAERPLDCAGSFKAEGLGIGLFERIENEDPTALIGLPLIALARMLRAAGVAA